MHVQPGGYAPLISPKGTWISFGHEVAACYNVANPADVRRAILPVGGAIYPCGWWDDDVMAIERPFNVDPNDLNSPLMVEIWEFFVQTGVVAKRAEYPVEQWPGHNKLPVINDRVMSYHSPTKRVFHETLDITPAGEVVEAPQWDGTFYLYQNSLEEVPGNAWKTYVRRASDGKVQHVIGVPLMYAKPYDLHDQCFVTGWIPGQGAAAWNSLGVMKTMPGEGVGAISTDGHARVMVWTCLSDSTGMQRGVFGRLWNDFEPNAFGVWVEGMWHSELQIRETGAGWLIAAHRNDTGEQRSQLVRYDVARVTRPRWDSTPVDPPVDPPPVDPPVDPPPVDPPPVDPPNPPQPEVLTLVVNPLAGRAILRVRATVFDSQGPARPDVYTWWMKHEKSSWYKAATTDTHETTLILIWPGLYRLHVDRSSDKSASPDVIINVTKPRGRFWSWLFGG